MLKKKKVLVVFGTRPEAIKMAPVIRELEAHAARFETLVCVTAQHREMLDQVLELFRIKPQYDLGLMQEGQGLSELTARILTSVDLVIRKAKPDWVLVQGDTTTSMAASLAAFFQRTRLGHIEAGLRTQDRYSPFPEEINRRMTSVLADLHFAPTERARQALLAEGICQDKIAVTGNTVVDALFWVRAQAQAKTPTLPPAVLEGMKGKRLILVTGHRRESFGETFEQICFAITDIVTRHPDVCVVYPVHLNPNVRGPVHRILGSLDRVFLESPLPYGSFVHLMDLAYLILTDSGGIQEEAPSLGKPVLVMREVTERPEAVNAGCAVVVGVKRAAICEAVDRILIDRAVYSRMTPAANPYGDGMAAKRIVSLLEGIAI
jgi:UDP-N-acetylglucosamine 2-epimerase (non-hydrolysing)